MANRKVIFLLVVVMTLVFIIGTASLWFSKIDAKTDNGWVKTISPDPLEKNDFSFFNSTSSRLIASEQKKTVFNDYNEKFNVPILMYHHIGNNPNPKDTAAEGLYLPTEIFDQQLQIISQLKYQNIKVSDLAKALINKKNLPPKAIVLTFDDGYQDFYTNVFPLLGKYQVKATLYVISDFLGRPDYVTAEQIKEMSDSGLVEIGSHTLNHHDLKFVTKQEAAQQINESKSRLEKILGAPIYSFAYPYGGFAKNDFEYLLKAGYLSAASTLAGTWQSVDNIFFLYRVRPGRKTGEPFKLWLNSL